MLIAIKEADALVRAALERIGYTPDEAVIIADHVMGCELRGVSFGGLARTLADRPPTPQPAPSDPCHA